MTDTAPPVPFDFSRVARCRIHPGIGIARVGNSPDDFFIGPETPGALEPRYKDTQGRVRRQAARFRLYGYDSRGELIGELPLQGPSDGGGADDKARVEWQVHLANSKGAGHRFAAPGREPLLRNAFSVSGRYPDTRAPDERPELVIDPGPRTIGGRRESADTRFDSGRFLGTVVPLGELRTDGQGRLLVLGGAGHAASTTSNNPIGADAEQTDYWANNDHWHDDVSDGPVTASVVLPGPDGRRIEVSSPEDAAWVVVAPPDYAPGVQSVVTLHDVVREVAIDQGWLDDTDTVDVRRDILPVLQRTSDLAWVSNDARRGHKVPLVRAYTAAERKSLVTRLRKPGADAKTAQLQASPRFMPPLSGDGGAMATGQPQTWLTLLPSQYRRFVAWQDGGDDPVPGEALAPFDTLPPEAQVERLQRAALEPAVGGAFHPGVEVGALITRPATYAAPFRIDSHTVRPGDLTRPLALPWHAGLALQKGIWWPSARPDDVIPEDVFLEVDSAWRAGGKPVAEGLEGRVRWDRGLGVSTLLRRPWRNPATAEDDPRDARRRVADDMVRYWHELGVVVPRRTASGEVLHVETERRPHAGMDIRELFHGMLNLERNRSCLGKAREYVEAVLQAAREVQRLPSAFNFMNNVRPFAYSEAVFDARLKDIYDDCVEFGLTEGGRRYNARDPQHNPYFQTRDSVTERLRQLTPFNFLDGAWLRNVHRLGPMDEVNSILFSIFNEELGDGVLSQNHANVYRDLCHSFGYYPPPVASTAFAQDPKFLDAAFESTVFQLGIAEWPDHYYPEIIGMTLWLEWTSLELHRVASIVEAVGLDSHFYRLHIAIDNAEDGHAAVIVRAVKIYLHQVMLQGGDEAMQRQWQRIWDGYVAFALTFAILMQQVIRVVKEPRTRQAQLEELIERKKGFGQYNHGTKTLGGCPVNQWFNDPKGFLQALVDHRLVIPGKPDESPFFELLGFRGPMYHVFTEDEIKLWREWTIEEAAPSGAPDAARKADTTPAERRLAERWAGSPSLNEALGPSGWQRVRRVASVRRIGLWLDTADRGVTAPGDVVRSRFETWLAWSVVRALGHLAAQPLPEADAVRPNALRDLLAGVKSAGDPVRAATEAMARLRQQAEARGPAAASLLGELDDGTFGAALEAPAPGNDGRSSRDVLAVWLDSGAPLPTVTAHSLKPLRLEATLDEEEQHPTGVPLGFGAVH